MWHGQGKEEKRREGKDGEEAKEELREKSCFEIRNNGKWLIKFKGN